MLQSEYSYPTTDGPWVQPFDDLVIVVGSRDMATAYVELGPNVAAWLDRARRY